jgi:hypothetical protein
MRSWKNSASAADLTDGPVTADLGACGSNGLTAWAGMQDGILPLLAGALVRA